MALDFATLKTGFAIYKKEKLVDYGLIKSSSSNVHARLLQIRDQILEQMQKHDIQIIVLEEVPMNSSLNMRVSHDLCVGQGVILGLCFDLNLGFRLYLPPAWRTEVGVYDGTREGTKRDVQKQKAVDIVNEMYGLNLKYFKNDNKKNESEDDVAEAILLGLAYVRSGESG
jgi:Holliday junction resolvasome RuvABC endonuclease subunit